MSFETMGSTIAELRKKKKITQEELADYVGVSAQAVSKWEKGGAPDCALLPMIADFFGVSIDTLFGRSAVDYEGVEEALAKKIMDTPYNEKLDCFYKLCWNMQLALFGQPSDKHILSNVRAENESPNGQVLSEFHNDEGFTTMGLDGKHPYFMLIPQSPKITDISTDNTEMCAFFKSLSDPAIFDAIILLCRHPNSHFSALPFAQKLGIDENTANEVLAFLVKINCLAEEQIEMDCEICTVYRCRMENLSAFTPILLLVRRIIENNTLYYFYNGNPSPLLK